MVLNLHNKDKKLHKFISGPPFNLKILQGGGKAKEIMNIIYERTGIRYHEVHIYRLLHKCGFSPNVTRKRFVNTASNKEKKQFRPIMTVTESHQKTYVFGTLLTIYDKQLFRQYKTFDQYSIISYLRELKRKFYKLLILFLDRAPPQHCRSKRVRAYLERNNDDDVMTVEYYLPKEGSPEFSALEEMLETGKR